MGKDPYIGLACVHQLAPRTQVLKSSNTMGIGGEGYLMGKASIKKLMVLLM